MNEQKFISNGVSAIRRKKDQEWVWLKDEGQTKKPLKKIILQRPQLLKKNEKLKCMKSIADEWFIQRSDGGDIYYKDRRVR